MKNGKQKLKLSQIICLNALIFSLEHLLDKKISNSLGWGLKWPHLTWNTYYILEYMYIAEAKSKLPRAISGKGRCD